MPNIPKILLVFTPILLQLPNQTLGDLLWQNVAHNKQVKQRN